MNEAKLIDLLGNEVAVTSYTLSDEHFITPVKLTKLTLEAIRQIVREVMQEELHKANMVILSAEEFDALTKRAAQ